LRVLWGVHRFVWIGLNKRSRLTHRQARGRGNTLCLCCIGSAATGVVSSISLMVSFPIEIRPCTPDSETTPPLPTPHASTTLVQDAASGTSSCKRVANGSAIQQGLVTATEIHQERHGYLSRDEGGCWRHVGVPLGVGLGGRCPQDSGNHGLELAEHLVPVVRFWSGEPHLCAQ
jgi:hypothetical protein